MPFVTPEIFIPDPIQTEVGEDQNKRAFGVELAKGHRNAFEAALVVFPDTRKALWASREWLNDPLVIASRDDYLDDSDETPEFLDKRELAAKVLQQAEAKNVDGTRYLVDAKDRVSFFKLYSEIAGYTGKAAEIDASTKNFTDNSMTIKIVSANKEQPKVIEAQPNKESQINNDDLGLKLKLIKAS